MRSSISSSELLDVRDIPSRAWLHMAAVAMLFNVVLLGAWELHVRSLGYEPDLDDTPRLWAEQRKRVVGAGPEQMVLVGASRTMFDLDLDVLEQGNAGARPIQLATVGSNPSVVLTHLAEDPTYAGTTLVGVVPGLFAAAGGPPMTSPKRYVAKYEHWGPADDWEHALSLALQERLAFIQDDDLTLKRLVARIRLPNRPGTFDPELPPNFARIDRDRRTRITERAEHDVQLMRRVQQIWLPLFTPPAKPPILSAAQWDKILADGWTAILAQTKRNVQAIERRGGRVIFVRDPSDGALRELEDTYAPRAEFWDRLLAETGAPGIYDRDYPELTQLACPEWSHLSARDSIEYTKRLVTIMQREALLPMPIAALRTQPIDSLKQPGGSSSAMPRSSTWLQTPTRSRAGWAWP